VTESGIPQATFRGFLFADLRGYSDYLETHGDRAGVELLDGYRRLIRSIVARFDGAEIRTEGDSFYIVFPSASRAVTCAVEIVAAAQTEASAIPVGIGVHAGEAADTGEGPVGSAVNVAARVCAQAAAGEVLVTDVVRILTRTTLDYRFVPRGTPRLKGIHEPMPVFRVVPAEQHDRAVIGRRASHPSERWPRRIGVGIAIALTAVGIGVVAVSLSSLAQRPPGVETSPSPAASASPALTGPEADLAARMSGLSTDERASCRAATADERRLGATTSVVCPLSPGGGATLLRLDDFTDIAPMLSAFSPEVTAHGSPTGDCATAPSGYGDWNVPRVAQGKVLCYPSGGDSYIVWTYDGGDGAGIMGTAMRSDMLWAPLYEWWRTFHSLVAY
jgi:hypothetical protein